MRFLRFLLKELVLHGIVFAIVGTIVLSALYLLSIGAPADGYLDALKAFLLMLVGHKELSQVGPGFTSGQIIFAGAAQTLPLALIALIFLILIALVSGSYSVTSRYMSLHFGETGDEKFEKFLANVLSLMAAVPLFVGFWLLYTLMGQAPLPVISLVTVLLGGLAWDGTNFLKTDMLSQVDQTHAIVFSTLGRNLGKFFPIPGTYSGYLFSSSLPRFIPYLAGKVPAIIGSVTIAEIAFDFPGLGKNLIDALINKNTDLLITSVFILLCINAIVSFLVKTVLFLIYPRWYEKAI